MITKFKICGCGERDVIYFQILPNKNNKAVVIDTCINKFTKYLFDSNIGIFKYILNSPGAIFSIKSFHINEENDWFTGQLRGKNTETKTKFRLNFVSGRLVGTSKWWKMSDGSVDYKYNHDTGLEISYYTSKQINKKIKRKVSKKGTPLTLSISFYPNGNLKEKMKYVSEPNQYGGNPLIHFFQWNENGRLIERTYYIHKKHKLHEERNANGHLLYYSQYKLINGIVINHGVERLIEGNLRWIKVFKNNHIKYRIVNIDGPLKFPKQYLKKKVILF
jgi:hypothetical protein